MHEIPNTTTLADTLGQREVSKTEWTALGVCLRRFHGASVYHSDLNAHNILLDDKGDIFLIDFDKSRIRSRQGQGKDEGKGKRWKLSTLNRLQRSLKKCQENSEPFFYDHSDWDTLQQGYRCGDPASQSSSRSA